MTHVYFVSYRFVKPNEGRGYGRCEIYLNSHIENITTVKDIEDILAKKNGCESCCIINFQLLRTMEDARGG